MDPDRDRPPRFERSLVVDRPSKNDGVIKALSDVSLVCRPPGEVAALMNGAGKSTLVKILCGVTPALDKRDKAWTAFKASHPKIREVARWGAVDDTPAQTVANQTNAVFKAHPDLNVILAPWDEFGRGAKIATDEAQLGKQVKVYSVDVSTSDIQSIREANSPWVATVAISASGTGAAATRAAALALTGELKQTQILLPPTLITQKFLNDSDVKSEEDLNKKLPGFHLDDAVTADWIKSAGPKG